MSDKKECEKLIEQYEEEMDIGVANIDSEERFGSFEPGLSLSKRIKHIKWRNKIKDCFEGLSLKELFSFTHHEEPDIRKWATEIIEVQEKQETIRNNWFLRNFIPKHDEVSLYLVSLSFILLSVFSESFQEKILFDFVLNMEEGTIMFLAGIVLIIYHAFSTRKKMRVTKKLMLFAAVTLNGWIGIYGTFHMLNNTESLLVIFPILNIISAVLLLLLMFTGFITHKRVSERQARYLEIIISSILVFILFGLNQFVWGSHWAVTFSVCTIYATNINDLIDRFFEIFA